MKNPLQGYVEPFKLPDDLRDELIRLSAEHLYNEGDANDVYLGLRTQLHEKLIARFPAAPKDALWSTSCDITATAWQRWAAKGRRRPGSGGSRFGR